MRNNYLDWLRGFSILTVLMTHEVFPSIFSGLLRKDLAENLSKNGYLGVFVFFVISGFLITSRTLARRGDPSEVSVPEFYAMRAARILPLMVLFILVQIFLFSIEEPSFSKGSFSDLYDAISYIITLRFNTHMVETSTLFPALIPIWSLSIEELFYAVFPVALLILRWRSILVLGMVALVLTGPFSRRSPDDIYSWAACADALSLGCIIGICAPYLYSLSFRIHAGIGLMLIGSITIGCQFTLVPIQNGLYLGPTIVAVGTAFFVAGAHMTPNLPKANLINIAMTPLAILGRLSYEIYLFHLTIFYTAYNHLPDINPQIRYYAQVALIFAASAALHHFYTEPLNFMLRARWLPTRYNARASERGLY